MRIFLAGGGGFLGSSICDRLLREHYSLRVFERPRVEPYRSFLATEDVDWVTGDFASRYDLEKALDGIDAVIHLVSTTLPANSNDDPVYDVGSNLVPTLQLLDIMAKKRIKRIIFISSGGTIYGLPQSVPISENHPTEPICSYGITKLAIEKHLFLYKKLHGIQPTILRLANPYGPRQRVGTGQGVITTFLYLGMCGQPIQIWGDGNVVRDYIYVEDAAEAFAAALMYKGEDIIFNIGTGTGLSLNQLMKQIECLTGKLNVQYHQGRKCDVPINILCIDKAIQQLSWSPTIGIDEGLSRTAEAVKKSLENLKINT